MAGLQRIIKASVEAIVVAAPGNSELERLDGVLALFLSIKPRPKNVATPAELVAFVQRLWRERTSIAGARLVWLCAATEGTQRGVPVLHGHVVLLFVRTAPNGNVYTSCLKWWRHYRQEVANMGWEPTHATFNDGGFSGRPRAECVERGQVHHVSPNQGADAEQCL